MIDQEKEHKLYETHDRIEELIGQLSEKLNKMFPENWEEIEKQILVDRKNLIQDAEITNIVKEIQELENNIREDNVWIDILNS